MGSFNQGSEEVFTSATWNSFPVALGLYLQQENKLPAAKCCNAWLQEECRTSAKSTRIVFLNSQSALLLLLFNSSSEASITLSMVIRLLREFVLLEAQSQIIKVNVRALRKVSSFIVPVRHPLPVLIKWPCTEWTTIHNETIPIGWMTDLLKITLQVETLYHKGAKHLYYTGESMLFFFTFFFFS